MLKLHEGNTSIGIQTGSNPTDIMFVIIHHSVRVYTYHEHMLVTADAVSQMKSEC
jgi:hypothetical protein